MGAAGGIDLGGTKIQAVVVDEQHQVLGQARRPTPRDGGPPGIAEAIVEALREAAGEAGVETAGLDGVGVGSPGAVDERAGTVEQARNLGDWEGPFPLGEALSRELGTAVRLGNDVQVAVDAEFSLGAGQPYSSVLGVFWGTGVGGGIVLDGKPWVGRGAAGEIGHMVIQRNGARCGCGRRGCVEAYSGRASLEERARRAAAKGQKTRLFELMEERGQSRATSGIWARALEHGDLLATRLIDRAVEALGTGIASAVNLLDIEAVIVGGGLGTRLGEPYTERIAEAALPHMFGSERPPPFHVAALGDLGGAIGASLLISRAGL
jgi:glucokinase